jgi:hypothetical protein
MDAVVIAAVFAGLALLTFYLVDAICLEFREWLRWRREQQVDPLDQERRAREATRPHTS